MNRRLKTLNPIKVLRYSRCNLMTDTAVARQIRRWLIRQRKILEPIRTKRSYHQLHNRKLRLSRIMMISSCLPSWLLISEIKLKTTFEWEISKPVKIFIGLLSNLLNTITISNRKLRITKYRFAKKINISRN
jgi:hypothetical protein